MTAWIIVHMAFALITMAIHASTHLASNTPYRFWRSFFFGLFWPAYIAAFLLVVWFYTRDKLDIQEILQKMR